MRDIVLNRNFDEKKQKNKINSLEIKKIKID
jgi:hypothetical protein